jgi:hypothetical protein
MSTKLSRQNIPADFIFCCEDCNEQISAKEVVDGNRDIYILDYRPGTPPEKTRFLCECCEDDRLEKLSYGYDD